ncbi:Tryptase [Zancudomyces culisetae]|uniref:Tryptase n=1 Tax=Zancudomyces culisetae TaxID=1213189 RepID=A0A1R1PNG8_ZANCU|nr:Tryptase [Zancudomyces culisetae]|eukprot:OMH82494.1 Tryptase [Zancudomyces culisetae]
MRLTGVLISLVPTFIVHVSGYAVRSGKVLRSDLDQGSNEGLVTNIINGVQTDSDEFGFAAQIFLKSGNSYRFVCTGSLITENYILTAGHCAITNNVEISPDSYRIVLGSRSLGNPNSGTDYYNVVKVNPGNYATNSAHDIALLKLEKSVPNSVATPIKVYSFRVYNKLPVTVAGWGVTTAGSATPSNILLKTVVDISSSSNCTNYNRDWTTNYGPLICQESYTGNDSCQGDSGGPLVTVLDGEQVLVGMTSNGSNKDPSASNECGDNSIAFYTRIGYFLKFISDETGVSIGNLSKRLNL